LIRLFLSWTLALLLLSGCAGVPLAPDRPPAAQIEQFVISGRIAVRQGESRHHARIDWRHESTHDEIFLTTPLGQGGAALTRYAAGARRLLADQRRFAADDWNSLAQQVFGFPLPLSAATRWVLGDLRVTAGWRVTVLARESDAADALPTEIELERDDIAVLLRIDEWSEVR
jgi:outer membrane lipoprotein LolB